MRLKLFLCVTVLLAALCAPVRVSAGDRTAFSLRVGAAATIPTAWHGDGGFTIDMYRPGTSMSLGGHVRVALAGGWYVEPGVVASYSHFRYDELYTTEGGFLSDSDPAVDRLIFAVPVVAGYTFDLGGFGLSVFTGPELSLGAVGRFNPRKPELWEGVNRNIYSKEMNRVGASWKVGAMASLGMFEIGLEAAIGMTDMLQGAVSCRESRVGATIGYCF